MLYSEKELEKCLKAGCALYYFYASDEALVHTAAQKSVKFLLVSHLSRVSVLNIPLQILWLQPRDMPLLQFVVFS